MFTVYEGFSFPFFDVVGGFTSLLNEEASLQLAFLQCSMNHLLFLHLSCSTCPCSCRIDNNLAPLLAALMLIIHVADNPAENGLTCSESFKRGRRRSQKRTSFFAAVTK